MNKKFKKYNLWILKFWKKYISEGYSRKNGKLKETRSESDETKSIYEQSDRTERCGEVRFQFQQSETTKKHKTRHFSIVFMRKRDILCAILRETWQGGTYAQITCTVRSWDENMEDEGTYMQFYKSICYALGFHKP